MGSKLLSRVIPCYKQAQYLEEAIEIVVSQTFSDWEIIVVNDGSPDDTSCIVQKLIELYPERQIRMIEKENEGLAKARNTAIEAAFRSYILSLDAVDKLLPDMLLKTIRLLERIPEFAIAYTDLVQFGNSSNITHASEYDFSRLLLQNQLNCCSLFRLEVWVAVGAYNSNLPGYKDWDFCIGCGELGSLIAGSYRSRSKRTLT